MNMPVTGNGSPTGTGNRPRVAPTRPGTPAASLLVQGAQTAAKTLTQPVTPVDASSNQTYANGVTQPSAVTMPELNLVQKGTIQDVEALLSPGAAIAPDRKARLETLARSLGFKDLGMLNHHLRNLSPVQRQGLVSALRTHFAKGEKADAAVIKEQFQLAFRFALDGLFSKNPNNCLPAPQFVNEPADADLWDTASLASVYNALATVEQQDPKRFEMVAKSGRVMSDGQSMPLTFVRRTRPEVENPDRFMDTMLQSVQIAHTDPDNGEIFLYDTAVKGNHRLITDLVVDKLTLISRFDTRLTDKGVEPSPELKPVYEPGEIKQRKLERQPQETDAKYADRLRGLISGDLLQRFGNNDPKRLQEALNFIIRYKGLDDPATINKGLKEGDTPKDPILPVSVNGDLKDPATLAALARLGPPVLMMVICRMEQADAVAQLQGFMKGNLPGSETLAVDGMMGKNTRMMVTSFQTSIALNNLKERIEDDRSLPEARKQELILKFNGYFQALGKDPAQAQQLLGNAINEVKALIALPANTIEDSTRQALVQDLTKMQELVSGRFNPTTANYLVSNWLNVMDSGKGNDLAEQLVVHEVSHIWQHELDKHTALEVEKNWAQLFGGGHEGHNHGVGGAHEAHDMQQAASVMTMGDFHECLQNDHCASSDYGQSSAGEDFAEAARLMSSDPARLMRRSLMKFLLVNALSGKPMGAEEITKLAENCGYKPEQLRERLDAFLGRGANATRFTLPMSTHLQQTYDALSKSLKAAEHPVAVSFHRPPSTAQTAGGEHETAVPATPPKPPISPSESGYVFAHLTVRYRELYEQLGKATKPADKAAIQKQIDELTQTFLKKGPAKLDNAADEGKRSFLAALDAHGYSGDKATQGYAIVAALAIFRATGSFKREEHPELAPLLPEAFDRMSKDRTIMGSMEPGARFAPTHMLEASLDHISWAQQNRADIDARIGSANLYLSKLNEVLAPLCSALESAGYGAMNLLSGIFGSSTNNSEAESQLRDAFKSNRSGMSSARNQINQAILILNRTIGSNYPPLSESDMQTMLFELNKDGAKPMTRASLESFLLRRTLGQNSSQKVD